jgi:hypothetical protein
MKDDYLWDGSGEPDPEIQKLESALAKFRHQEEAPEFPAFETSAQPQLWRRYFSWPWPRGFGIAAVTAIILLVIAVGLFRWSQKPNAASGASWVIESVAGTPLVESGASEKGFTTSRLGIGQTLTTDGHSRATISVADVGTVSLEPGTRLRLVFGGKERNQFALERGTIHAFIWAAPGDFTVDTPSAIAVDLGCAYTLQVHDSGAGLLRTTFGWVGFKLKGREAFIPAGAVCRTRPKIGPGTPYFEDASASFREALTKFDFAPGTPQERSAELGTILAEARPRDALTVWHLLSRVGDTDRGRVYDRLATLAAPPAGVTREGVLRLDQKTLDQWWNQLGLGDISLWRTWERSWSQNKT